MANAVLDASALLAFVNGEPGAEIVARVIGDALISTVNIAETLSILAKRTGSLQAAKAIIGMVALELVDFDRALAERVAELVLRTRPLGLSLGDRACLALAARESLPAVTADRSWSALAIGVEIRLIR
jgi:ribonuclease VapC